MKNVLLALIGFVGLGHFISLAQAVKGGAIKQDRILQFGIVDCLSPGNIRTSRLTGVVVDPSGVPVPHATVSVTANENPQIATVTDSRGHFSLKASAGKYLLSVKVSPFVGTEAGVTLGRDVMGAIHPANPYVILGLAGSFCPWITTSAKAFRRTISENNNRIQEGVKGNATQE